MEHAAQAEEAALLLSVQAAQVHVSESFGLGELQASQHKDVPALPRVQAIHVHGVSSNASALPWGPDLEDPAVLAREAPA